MPLSTMEFHILMTRRSPGPRPHLTIVCRLLCGYLSRELCPLAIQRSSVCLLGPQVSESTSADMDPPTHNAGVEGPSVYRTRKTGGVVAAQVVHKPANLPSGTHRVSRRDNDLGPGETGGSSPPLVTIDQGSFSSTKASTARSRQWCNGAYRAERVSDACPTSSTRRSDGKFSV